MTAHERTGWRDEAISRRHRMWGFNCPGADLDFLMVEYNRGVPCALVEYKHYRAAPVDLRAPTYRALLSLAESAKIPFFVAHYWPETWAFIVTPANLRADLHYFTKTRFTEREFVATLYELRRLKLAGKDAEDVARLNAIAPPDDACAPTLIREAA